MKKIAVATAVLFPIALLAIWVSGGFSKDPRRAELEQLQARLSDDGKKLPRDEQRKLWQEMRQKMDQLPEEDRQEIRREMWQERRVRMEQELDAFFALPPDKQKVELDKRIDQMEKWRKDRAARPQGDRGQRSANGRGGNGGNRGRNASEQERNKWRKRMLDNTDPKQRAQWRAYRDMMNDRRKERGLPERRGGGGRWG